jgi:hypothetical protein
VSPPVAPAVIKKNTIFFQVDCACGTNEPNESLVVSNLRLDNLRLLLLLWLGQAAATMDAQTTAFTYQGQLLDNGAPANGAFDLQFSLFDAPTGGNPVGAPRTSAATAVANGLFAVPLDFGAAAFSGPARWLQIGVRAGGGNGAFTLLTPLQQITAAPYAITANGASNLLGVLPASQLSGTLPAGQLSGSLSLAQLPSALITNAQTNVTLNGTFTGNASGLTNLNAAQLTAGTVPMTQLPGALITNNQAFVVLNGGFSGFFSGNGGGLNSLSAGNLSGTVPSGALSGVYGNAIVLTNPGNVFAGNGAGLSNLPSAAIRSSLPSGVTVVSMQAQDRSLLTNGYQFLTTIPAPPWANGSTVNEASARYGHSAIWDGQALIVWGGNIGSIEPTYVNSGGIYDPAADQWRTTSTVNPPDARAGHTAVWSGTAMIVWGGSGNSGYVNTGGAFQPAAQQWTPVSLTGAPAARGGHIAVWTGDSMFVWGGQNLLGLLNDGALYDPVALQWTVLNLANPPQARLAASAVWTGTQVIIWGGSGVGGALNSGAELLFSSGAPSQWVAMNSANAPSPRLGHTAVWTGRVMIVWGGQNGGVALGDGAVFDPLANSWTPISLNNAPAARFNHSALWTGQEMLIMDGSDGSTELSSASAYNPATDQWRTLSNSGNPLARTQGGAVWTGTQAVVFGGQAGGQPVAALQTLVPQPTWYFYSKL